jgi:hypothetical protein
MVADDTPQQAVSFPGMDPTEQFRFYFQRHWIKVARYLGFLISWMIAFVLLVPVSGVTATPDDFTRRILVVLLVIFFLVPHFIFIAKIYKHFLCLVIVTDKKVHQFKRTLLAMDTQQSVDLLKLQDIDKLQRSIVQNVFGFGSLKLEAQNTQLRIHFVPRVNEVYNAIMYLRESARSGNVPT